MPGPTDALEAILTEMDELLRGRLRELGFEETPFAILAVSPDNRIILQGNLDPITLALLSEALCESAEETSLRPADDEQVH